MAEWGRVLVSVAVASETTTPGRSTTTMTVEVTGDEVSPTEIVLCRVVEVDGDPDDLAAPLRYACNAVDTPADLIGSSTAGPGGDGPRAPTR